MSEKNDDGGFTLRLPPELRQDVDIALIRAGRSQSRTALIIELLRRWLKEGAPMNWTDSRTESRCEQ